MLKKDASELKIDVAKIFELFEKNIQQGGEPLVSITACGILSDILSTDSTSATFIQNKLSQANSLQLLQQLLDINKPKSDIKKIDGSNFGCPYSGYYDLPFSLLQKLLMKQVAEKKKDLI